MSELHVFLAHPKDQQQAAEKQWVVVDWTYPANSVLRGEYGRSTLGAFADFFVYVAIGLKSPIGSVVVSCYF